MCTCWPVLAPCFNQVHRCNTVRCLECWRPAADRRLQHESQLICHEYLRCVCAVVRSLRRGVTSSSWRGNDPSAFVACSCASLSNELHSHKSWPDLLSLVVTASPLTGARISSRCHTCLASQCLWRQTSQLCCVCRNHEVSAGNQTHICTPTVHELLALLSANKWTKCDRSGDTFKLCLHIDSLYYIKDPVAHNLEQTVCEYVNAFRRDAMQGL